MDAILMDETLRMFAAEQDAYHSGLFLY